jgi:hypothetical protein
MTSGMMRFAAMVLLMAASAATYASQTISTTLGPNNEYNGDLAAVIQNTIGGYRAEHAVRFTPVGTDFLLETTRLPLFRQIDLTLPINLFIAADVGGVPGPPIASQFYDGNLPVADAFVIETAPPTDIYWSNQNVILSSGKPYWLYITGAPGNPYDVGWYINSIGAVGNRAMRTAGPGGDPDDIWFPLDIATPAFAILGTPVPEPGVIGFAVGGALALATVRCGRRVRPAGKLTVTRVEEQTI